jgi:adenosylmethionine-8-amino-7-oxononanoate aminotransferase
VQPDIQSFAKAVTSGYAPLGGIVVSRDIFETMNTVKPEDRWMHAATYSGHPMCCAVGLANIAIMERERLWERSARLGTRLYQGLLELQKELPAIGDVRGGKGLIAAVELVSDRTTKAGFVPDQKVGLRMRRDMEKRGLATRIRSYPLPDGTVSEMIFFSPPLVITEQQIDRVLEIVRAAIKAVVPA